MNTSNEGEEQEEELEVLDEDLDTSSEGEDKEEVSNDSNEDELKRLTGIVDGYEADKVRDELIGEIKIRHPDFEPEKIKSYLKELHSTDPQQAKDLNNPLGWEVIHLREFEVKDVDNDYFGHGREGERVDRSQEILDKVQKGGVTRADEALVLHKLM